MAGSSSEHPYVNYVTRRKLVFRLTRAVLRVILQIYVTLIILAEWIFHRSVMVTGTVIHKSL